MEVWQVQNLGWAKFFQKASYLGKKCLKTLSNQFILLNQLSRLNKSYKWMAPKLGKNKIGPNTMFRNFFPNFLIILQQQKTSSERDDLVILFSFW